MKTIFDLPTHPLVVHLPVVLIPLVALAALVVALRPAWRAGIGPFLVGGSVVGFIGILLARQSGDAMYELLLEEPSISRHRDLADQATVLTLLFVLALAAWIGLGWYWDRAAAKRAVGDPVDARQVRRPAWVLPALSVLAVVLGVASSTWVARTGHEGAKSHWGFVADLEDGQGVNDGGR